ncbi:hypothetical protein GCM10027091_74220 [Streptomyces daliensis]
MTALTPGLTPEQPDSRPSVSPAEETNRPGAAASGRRRRLLLVVAGATVAVAATGAALSLHDGGSAPAADFCWSLAPQSEPADDGSLRACGDALETAATGRPAGSTAPEEAVRHTDEQARMFKKIVTSYGAQAPDGEEVPVEIAPQMANVLAHFHQDVHQVLGRTSRSASAGDPEVPHTALTAFMRSVSAEDDAFRTTYRSQLREVSREIDGLTKEELTRAPGGADDRARAVVERSGSVIGGLVQARDDALKAALDGEPDSATEEKLAENYEKNGYPRLRHLLHAHASKVGVPADELADTGGRMGDLTGWTSSAYRSA